VLSIGQPSPARLQAALERAGEQDLTYPEVGATAGNPPSRYRRSHRRVVLGHGDDVLARAAGELRRWRMHEGAGLVVHPAAPTAEPGTTVVLAVPLGPVWRLAPCRVVWTADDAGRRGFAYGTLPGHPESGEEAFVVRRDRNGAVVLDLTVFSRLATWDSRILPPLSRAVQWFFTRRYLRAMRELARDGGGPPHTQDGR
jgi:uncharacterized protein (UPF0548 family)